MSRILVAEDEPDIRELIKITLEFDGHDVVGAKDGVEALEMAPSGGFDLILMDVRMPRMSGYEACRQLKSSDSTKGIPLVFLSAKGQESEVQAGLDVGADDYILKPFEPDTLTKKVAEILEM